MFKTLADNERLLAGRGQYGFFEDFDRDIVAGEWTTLSGTDGSATVAAGQFGIVPLLPAPAGYESENDRVFLHRKHATFKPTAGNPLLLESRFTFSEEDSTSKRTALIFGFMSAPDVASIQDGGLLTKASYSGAVFVKRRGSANWSIEVSVGSTKESLELNVAGAFDNLAKLASSATPQVLQVEIRPHVANRADAVFSINGVVVGKFKDWVTTSILDMTPVIGLKLGTTTAEQIDLDYIAGEHRR